MNTSTPVNALAPAKITLRGAKLNNLQSLNLDIPLGQFVVVTGPSGSGKSTLVFDLLYQEGQRRFLSSLSSYVRQYFERIDKPPVEQLSHLPPVIGLKQGQETRQNRATVASLTHVDDTLYQLFHLASQGHCPHCGHEHPLFAHNTTGVLKHFLQQYQRFLTSTASEEESLTSPPRHYKALLTLHVPLFINATLTAEEALHQWLKESVPQWHQEGIQRIDLNTPEGTLFETAHLYPLPELETLSEQLPVILASPWGKHYLDTWTQSYGGSQRKKAAQTKADATTHFHCHLPLVFRRLTLPSLTEHGLNLSLAHQNALEEALHFAEKHDWSWQVILLKEDRSSKEVNHTQKHTLGRYHHRYGCGTCGHQALEPNQVGYFNPHHALGACPNCEGYGWVQQLSEQKIIPNPEKSLRKGAVYPFQLPAYQDLQVSLLEAAKACQIRTETPWKALSDLEKKWVFKGDESLGYEGIEGLFQWVESKKYKPHMRMFLARFRSYSPCNTCHGTGHHPHSHTYTLANVTVQEVATWTIEQLYHWSQHTLGVSLGQTSVPHQDILNHLQERLRHQTHTLMTLGLGYLPLKRAIKTVSGGEHQRLLLASSLSHQLSDTLYLLDEPSLGLHTQDVQGLIQLIRALIAQGNSVIAVEHHRTLMEEADWLIELGPESGRQGGQCVAQGTLGSLMSKGTPTGHFLATQTPKPCSESLWEASKHEHWLTLEAAQTHNLKQVTARFPLKAWSCVTGVSGSGKTSLIIHTLVPALKKALHEPQQESEERWTPEPLYKALKGFNASICQQLVVMEQQKLHASSRSTPAIYLKVWDDIRHLFAHTREAIQLGLTVSDFSFNSTKGRCPKCEGLGTITVDMQFMADVKLVCDACHGRRFQPSILSVKYKQHSIDQVLGLTFREAQKVFSEEPTLCKKLEAIDTLGLGYLQLGQSLSTLSGGEAQRIKLLQQLLQPQAKPCIYVLDEPSAGLHPQDVLKLCNTLRLLCQKGHTIICIDHQETLLAHCDTILTLGPGGGDAGGKLIRHSESV
jgi:excinuclease ABC subunit A